MRADELIRETSPLVGHSGGMFYFAPEAVGACWEPRHQSQGGGSCRIES
jgi:hypothetical protein